LIISWLGSVNEFVRILVFCVGRRSQMWCCDWLMILNLTLGINCCCVTMFNCELKLWYFADVLASSFIFLRDKTGILYRWLDWLFLVWLIAMPIGSVDLILVWFFLKIELSREHRLLSGLLSLSGLKPCLLSLNFCVEKWIDCLIIIIVNEKYIKNHSNCLFLSERNLEGA
jgi:hypothetical protein